MFNGPLSQHRDLMYYLTGLSFRGRCESGSSFGSRDGVEKLLNQLAET